MLANQSLAPVQNIREVPSFVQRKLDQIRNPPIPTTVESIPDPLTGLPQTVPPPAPVTPKTKSTKNKSKNRYYEEKPPTPRTDLRPSAGNVLYK